MLLELALLPLLLEEPDSWGAADPDELPVAAGPEFADGVTVEYADPTAITSNFWDTATTWEKKRV